MRHSIIHTSFLFLLTMSCCFFLLPPIVNAMYQEPVEEETDNSGGSKEGAPAEASSTSSDRKYTLDTALQGLSNHHKWLLSKLFREKEQVDAMVLLADLSESQRKLLDAYIQATPVQRNTVLGLLSAQVPGELSREISLAMLPMEAEKYLYVSPKTGMYTSHNFKNARFLPNISSEKLATMALVLARFSGHFPDGIVHDAGAKVCDPSGPARCTAALISLLNQIDLKTLLSNATSLEALDVSLRERITELLQNGSLSLTDLNLDAVNFSAGNFFGLDRAYGPLVEANIDFHRFAVFTALVMGVIYGPPIMRATLRPLFTKVSHCMYSLYGKARHQLYRVPGADRAVGAAIKGLSKADMDKVARVISGEQESTELLALIASMGQEDVRNFVKALQVVSPEQGDTLALSLLAVLEADPQLFAFEGERHGHLLNDINDLVHGRGNRKAQVTNISATVAYFLITSVIVYGLIEWMNTMLGQHPNAGLHGADFPAACGNWSDGYMAGNGCVFVNGQIEYIHWPGNSQFGFDATIAAMALLLPSIKSFMRFGIQKLGQMVSTAFRLLLLTRCAFKPVTGGKDQAEIEGGPHEILEDESEEEHRLLAPVQSSTAIEIPDDDSSSDSEDSEDSEDKEEAKETEM